MILTFLLCFLSLIFSIYCIGIQPTNAAGKLDSTSCNPWEESGCQFSKDYLSELVKYYEYDKKDPKSDIKPFPNTYYKPPSYVDQIIKVGKDLGKDAAAEAIEKYIEDILPSQAAKTFVKRIGFLLDILVPSDIYPDHLAKKEFCKKNSDLNYCQPLAEKKEQFCKKNPDALKCKQPENWTCQVNPNTGKIECVSSPLKPNWVCGVNPNTGKDECIDSNEKNKPTSSSNLIEPNLKDLFKDTNTITEEDIQKALKRIQELFSNYQYIH